MDLLEIVLEMCDHLENIVEDLRFRYERSKHPKNRELCAKESTEARNAHRVMEVHREDEANRKQGNVDEALSNDPRSGEAPGQSVDFAVLQNVEHHVRENEQRERPEIEECRRKEGKRNVRRVKCRKLVVSMGE